MTTAQKQHERLLSRAGWVGRAAPGGWIWLSVRSDRKHAGLIRAASYKIRQGAFWHIAVERITHPRIYPPRYRLLPRP